MESSEMTELQISGLWDDATLGCGANVGGSGAGLQRLNPWGESPQMAHASEGRKVGHPPQSPCSLKDQEGGAEGRSPAAGEMGKAPDGLLDSPTLSGQHPDGHPTPPGQQTKLKRNAMDKSPDLCLPGKNKGGTMQQRTQWGCPIRGHSPIATLVPQS